MEKEFGGEWIHVYVWLSTPAVHQKFTTLLTGYQSVQSLSHVWLFATPWTVSHQASLSIINSQSLLKLMSIELVMLSNHLVLKRHQKQTNKTTRIPWAKSLLYFASSQSSSKPGYILSILLSVIIWNNLFKFLLLSLYPIPHFNLYTILSLSYRWIEWTPKLSCSKLLFISLPFFECKSHSTRIIHNCCRNF